MVSVAFFGGFQNLPAAGRHEGKKPGKNVNFPKKQLTKRTLLLYTIILKVSANLTGEINGLFDFRDINAGGNPHFVFQRRV